MSTTRSMPDNPLIPESQLSAEIRIQRSIAAKQAAHAAEFYTDNQGKLHRRDGEPADTAEENS